MENNEKEILTAITGAYLKMTEFQKGYLLGMAETIKEMKRKEEREQRRKDSIWK